MSTKKDKDLAELWNRRFDFASTKLPAGSNQIASSLDPILMKLSGKHIIQKNEDNPYFKVDSKYDGDPKNLFKHVTFKNIPTDDPEIGKYLENLVRDKGTHFNQQSYDAYYTDWQNKAYSNLGSNLAKQAAKLRNDAAYAQQMEQLYGENYVNTMINFDAQFVDTLREVMMSSPAWEMAKRGAVDSEQVRERWVELYNSMANAYQAGPSVFDWAYRELVGGRRSVNWMINTIDEEIKLHLQGKYSRRRRSRD